MNKTKKMVLISLFIALSYVGSLIKVQGSIAFDSLPAFLGALLIGPAPGAVIGALGHLLSSWGAGFYLGVPIHLIIALEMAVVVYAFGFIYRRFNWLIAIVVAIILNGIGSPLSLVPLFGWGFFSGIVWILLIASMANIILAYLVFKALEGRVK